MNRYILIINGTPFILGKRNLKNWDEISYSLKRNDFSGIISSFSSQFEFTEEAYNLLLDEYHTNYLKANAQIEVYSMDNERNKRLIYGSYLDFGSLEYDDTTVYINAIDNTLATKIKAKKSTQFEYLVAELKEEEPLYYDRLLMRNAYNFYIDSDEYVYPSDATLSNGNIDVYVVDDNNEVYVGGYLESYHEADGAYNGNNKGVFMKILAIPAQGMYMDLSFDISISSGNASFEVGYERKVGGDVYYGIVSGATTSGIHAGEVYNFDKKGLVLIDPLNNEYHKIGVIYRLYFNAAAGVKFKIENFKMTVYYMDNMQSELIDVIRPDIILNRLLKSINDEKDGYSGEIESEDERLGSTMIVAAESARGLENAKLYTSFKKFCDWMETVYGYVPVITDYKVTFKNRTSLFHSVIQKKISYTGDDFKVKVNSSLIYSLVKVGYDKQDYDSINGRDEFHFTNEYDTGITITDKVLELISPLRSDPYGIELLVSKRGKDTTDSESDNDTFFIGANLPAGSEYYKLVREAYSISGITSASSMFNVMFSPRSVIEANRGFIASFASNLRFASSSGNSDIVINDVAENSDIALTNPLFSVSTLDISTADGALPTDVNALVEVQRNSKLYTCFINELKYKIGRYDGVDYSLQIKNISIS